MNSPKAAATAEPAHSDRKRVLPLDARRACALVLLVMLAAALRLYAWSRSAAIFDDGPVFLYLAEAILEGDFAAVVRHPYHPGYPLAIAGVASLGVALEFAGVLVSVLAGALTVAVGWAFVREMFDEGAAWIAAVLFAIHPPSVVFSSDVQSEALYVMLFLSSAAAAWCGLRDARVSWAAVAGLLSGAAYLVRPEGLGIALVGIVGAGWLGVVGSWSKKSAAVWCTVFGLGAAATALPYVAAMQSESGSWALTQKKSVAELAGIRSEDTGPSEGTRTPRRVIPSNGPLPGTELSALARDPARPGDRLGSAAGELYFAAASALRVEVLSFLLVGLIALRGRPTRRALFLGVAIALYAGVLFALGATSGYVSRRHALPPLLLLFGYLAVGLRVLGTGTLAGIERLTRFQLRGRARWAGRRSGAGALLGLLVVAAFFLPRDLAARRTDRLAERHAAEWLAVHDSSGQPVAARRIRDAYYAHAPFVPIPVEGYAPAALLAYLQRSGARYVVIDDQRAGNHSGLREAIEVGMHRIFRAEAGGRTASVLEILPPQ